MKIQRALISVSDKTGLIPFAKRLNDLGVEILSTGGTAKAISDEGIPVIEISDYTNAPEMFDGRLKTIHPKVHGGLLYRRDHPDDPKQAEKNDIPPIDLLVVNLYPFEKTIAKEDVELEEAIENIDIGGPAMLRAASKNYKSVTVITDINDYDVVADEMEETDGETSLKTRERLAIKVFLRTGSYDQTIGNFLNKSQETDSGYSVSLPLASELRYGENPHQGASLYGNFGDYFKRLQGKDLSYTNVLDIAAAAQLVSEFLRPTVAILKHTNPCGVGCAEEGEGLREAWEKAFETDKQAPFGGVIVCNRPLDEALARVIAEIFTDIIIAPDFDSEARAILQKKKSLRLIKVAGEFFTNAINDPVMRSAPGGLLVMDADPKVLGLDGIEEKVKTKRPPSVDEIEAMKFGWRVCKHVKSNAIVLVKNGQTIGVGAGQMSRVEAVEIALKKANGQTQGAVCASDAFFPFKDSVEHLAKHGITAIIQPGGSKRDQESVDACDTNEVAMVTTGIRHFKH
mgnify:CR=1 FL=1